MHDQQLLPCSAHGPTAPAADGVPVSVPPVGSFDGRCACGASAFGQPPGRCYAHAREVERDRATHLLLLARRGIAHARHLAARWPDDPSIQQEACEWLVEAQDDLREATACLAALRPLVTVKAAHHQERR